MKKLILLGVASLSIVLLSACEEGQRDHDYGHHRGASTSTTTTEETSVRHAAPSSSSTTTVRSY